MPLSFIERVSLAGRQVCQIAGTVGVLFVSAASGDDGVAPRFLSQDDLFRQIGFQLEQGLESGVAEQPSPPYEPKEEPQPAPEPAESAEGPWTLTDIFTDDCGNNCFKSHNVKIYGNLVQSMTFNFQGPRDKFNGPVTWTDRSNEYQMNQLWIGMEKATDTSKNDWDWGGRIDMNYGTSSRLFTESGFEPHNYYGQAFYGLAFPNAYGEVAYKKLKVKIGRFVSPIGYFTVNTVDNFFNTIPYTYQWGEPFTHTGIWASYAANDNFLVTGGVIRGWDNFDNSNPHLGYLGTWGYTWQDKSNLTHVIIYSLEPNANFDFTPRYYQSLVYSKPITEKWVYVGQSDLGVQKNALASGKTAYWYGLNQYLYYAFSEKLTFGLNFEWWRDEEGYRVAGFLPSNLPSGITSDARGWSPNHFGYDGNFYQITIGPKWFPTASKNVFIRPNFRFDWFQGSVNNPDGLKPYDDGGKNYQTLFVTDVVLLF